MYNVVLTRFSVKSGLGKARVQTRSTRTDHGGIDGGEGEEALISRRYPGENTVEGDGDGSSEGGDVPDPSNTGGAFQEGKGSEAKRREIER